MRFLTVDEVIDGENALVDLDVLRFKSMSEFDDYIRTLADESESFEEKVFMLGEAELIQTLIYRDAKRSFIKQE